MSYKLTKRQVRSWKKANENKERHRELEELRRQRQTEGAVRRAAPPRSRDWQQDDDSYATREKIRRAEPLVRRPPVVPASRPSTPGVLGTVIEVRSGDSLVMRGGRLLRALLAPSMRAQGRDARSPLAVGDQVELEPVAGGQPRIVRVLPRRSALTRDVYDPSRRDAAHQGQVLAANIDQVVVVCSPGEPPFRPRLIDRYLVAASRDALPVVVCLNKVDLGVPVAVEVSLQGYARLGLRVLRTSAVTGAGLDELRGCIAGGISLFSGHSGVGKSSLLNAFEPGLGLRVAQVTQATAGQGKGRHTTSSARLVPLSVPETFVVDSPGIRAFGVRGLTRRELAGHFADIAALAPGCSYGDCLHRGEPGCAVATRAGDEPFLRARLESYRGMLAELR